MIWKDDLDLFIRKMQQEPILSIESFLIKDCVLGSFHQGDKRFGETAGIRYACMALTALCWSVIRKVRYGEHLILIIYSKVESLQKLREIWFTSC